MPFVPVIPLAQLRIGAMHAAEIDGRSIVICRTRDGVLALDNICTHAYARLNEGRLRKTRLVCPLHGAVFDTADGRALKGPATLPLAVHPVRLVEGMIEVEIDPQLAPQPSEF